MKTKEIIVEIIKIETEEKIIWSDEFLLKMSTLGEREISGIKHNYLFGKTIAESARNILNSGKGVALGTKSPFYPYVSRERARQIIAKGLRKLRHKQNTIAVFKSKELNECLFGYHNFVAVREREFYY